MAFTRPTLDELNTRIQSDIESRLTGGSKLLRRSVLKVLATIFAGAIHLVYGYLNWVYKQSFPDTAEKENLERWATIWGISRTPAEFSQGNVTFTGDNGSEIPASTEIQTSSGLVYTTDALGTIAAGTVTIAVTASVAGPDSDVDAATAISLSSPITGVTTQGVVASGGLTGGLEAESDEDLLTRLLARIQNSPHGGNEADYVAWAKEVAGVTRAWVLPAYLGLGTVGVTFVRDNDVGSIIPDAGEVTDVQDYIDDPTRRPVTADVTVYAPAAVPIAFTINVTPNTTAVKAAVQAELEDLILREAEPGGTILLTHIEEAISLAAGETDHALTVPAANVTVTTAQLSTMGTITWV